ncbi:hypothetical protein HBB16_15945 [Pseudonocardia sp. MCCB 268]|nr:hypothetical protein [Pseudonocardia cytotoxica]
MAGTRAPCRLDGQVSTRRSRTPPSFAAVDVPWSRRTQNAGPGPTPCAAPCRAAGGPAGCSIEDFDPEAGLTDRRRCGSTRVAAAVGEADGMRITARAENHLRGYPDLTTPSPACAPTLMRAPTSSTRWLAELADIERVVGSVDRPVNVLVHAAAPPRSPSWRRWVWRGSLAARSSNGDGCWPAGHELLSEGTHATSGVAG